MAIQRVTFPSFIGDDYPPYEMRQLVSALDIRFVALETAINQELFDTAGGTGDFALVGHTHFESEITDLQPYLLNINAESIFDLNDVTGTPADNWVLVYDAGLAAFVVQAPGSAAAVFLNDIADVSVPAPLDGEVLTYVSGSGEWEAVAPAAALTSFVSLTDTDLTGQGQYDLVFNADGSEWQPTQGQLTWNPAFLRLQFAKDSTINWIDESSVSEVLLHLDNTPGVTGDTLWSEVELLSKWEGADTATTYTEVSDNAASATFFDNAQIDTAQFSPISGSTSSLLLDGTDDYVTYPDIAAYDLDSDDWTIEGFVRFNTLPPLETSLGPGYMLFDMQNSGGALLQYAIIQDGFGYRVRLSGDGFAEVGTIGTAPVINTWYHWAMTRESGTIRAYFNGVYETSDFGGASANMGGPNQAIAIGRRTNGTDAYHDGWLDSYRITIGTARYTGTGAIVQPSEMPEFGTTAGTDEFLVGNYNYRTDLQGLTIRIPNSAAPTTDYGEFDHDGTDFNLAMLGTTDFNIDGLTKMDVAGTIEADGQLDLISTTATVSSPPVEADTPSLWMGFYGQNAEWIGGIGYYSSSNLNYGNDIRGGRCNMYCVDSGAAFQYVLVYDPDIPQLDLGFGNFVRINDAGDTDYAEFHHDGTDFITDFTNTGNWNITGLSGSGSLHLSGGPNLTITGGTFWQQEVADAAADFTTYGQWWVHDDAPNTARFTDDTGLDWLLNHHNLTNNTYVCEADTLTWADSSGNTFFFFDHDGGPGGSSRMQLDIPLALELGVTNRPVMYMNEIADAVTDFPNFGQWWVHDDTPNTPWFTDDAGGDSQLARLATDDLITGDWIFRDQITIQDSTGTDDVTISHDGTDLNIIGTTTTDINIAGITAIQGTADFVQLTGEFIRQFGPGTTGIATHSHDATDYNTVFSATTDWNITGLAGGFLNIDGGVVIAEDLTVNGTTTTINSGTVLIADNIIVLNSDEAGVPSQDAGIEIERGTSANVQFLWAETPDTWLVADPFAFAGGAVGAPGITWSGDENTGIYQAGAGSFGVTVDGTNTFNWSSNALIRAEQMMMHLDGASFQGIVSDQGQIGQFGFIDVTAGFTRFGSFNYDTASWEELELHGLNILFEAASGTDAFIWDIGGTEEMRLDGTHLWLQNGNPFRISDSTDADYAEFSHDGTDFNIAHTQTDDVNFTGITGEYVFDNPARLLANIATATPPTTESVAITYQIYDLQNLRQLASVGFHSEPILKIRNYMHGAAIELEAENNSGVVRTILLGDPDGQTDIYHPSTGSIIARSLTTAAGGLQVNNTLTGAGLERVLTTSDLVAAGGQVDSVSGGTNINVSGTAVDPIVNLDAAITGVSVNGVTLTTAGAATNYLDETGSYSTPAGGGNVSNTGTPLNNQIAVWTDATTIEGDANLTWNGTTFNATQGLFDGAPALIIENATAAINIRETGATADEGNWIIRANADLLRFQTATDAAPNSGVVNALQFARTGTVVDSATFDATQVIVSDGGTLRIEDSGSGDYGDFSHDGTDFLTAFTNTADWRVSGIGSIIVSSSVQMGEQATNSSPAAGDGEFWVRDDAPNVPMFTNDDGEDFNLLESSGGSTISAQYRWRTDTAEADPGAGRIRYDNATPASVTELYVSTTTDNGGDLQNILSFIAADDRVYFQVDSDAADYLLMTVTATIDNTGWFTIQGTVTNSGTLPSNNDRSHILILFGAAAGTGLVPSGSTEGDILAWDGSSAYRIASGVHAEATASPPAASEGYLRFNTTGTTDEQRPQIWWSALNTTSVHYFAETEAGPDGFYLRTRGNITPETHAWGYSLAGSDTDLFQIDENLDFSILAGAGLYIGEKGAAEADKTNFGQMYVDSGDGGLYYKYDSVSTVRLDVAAASALDDLTDVDTTGVATFDMLYKSAGDWLDTAGILTWNGTQTLAINAATATLQLNVPSSATLSNIAFRVASDTKALIKLDDVTHRLIFEDRDTVNADRFIMEMDTGRYYVIGDLIDLDNSGAATASTIINRNSAGGMTFSVNATTGNTQIGQTSGAGAAEDVWISMVRNGGVSLRYNNTNQINTGALGVQVDVPIYQFERAAADTNAASFGQWWVRDDVPNTPWFTTDSNIDRPLGYNSMPPVTISASQNFLLAEVGYMMHKSSGGAITLTCAQDSDTWDGATWVVHNDDTEDITITDGASVTLYWLEPGSAPAAEDIIVEAGGIVTIYKLSNTEFWGWGGKEALAGGGGNVSNTGTPLVNQIAVWTDATTIQGDPDFTWNGTIFDINLGDILVNNGQIDIHNSGGGKLLIWENSNVENTQFQQVGDDLYVTPTATGGQIQLRAPGETVIYDSTLRHTRSSTTVLDIEPDLNDFLWTFSNNRDWVVGGTLTGAIRFEHNLIMESGAGIYIAESASAQADTSGFGQFWVNNSGFNPSMPYFTGESGDDMNLAGELWDNGTLQCVATVVGIEVRDTLHVGDGGSGGNVKIGEQASADVDEAGYGQIWVRTETGSGGRLYFTSDDGSTELPVGMGAYNLIANQSSNMTTDSVAQSLVNGAWYSDNGTAYTLTLEPSTDTEFPVGAQMSVWNEGSGTLTISEGTGDTLYYMDGSGAPTDVAGSMTLAQGGFLTIIRKSTTVWLAIGQGGTP